MSCQQNCHDIQKSEKLSLKKKLYLNSIQFLNIYQIYQIVEHGYICIFITYAVGRILLNTLTVHLHQNRCIWVLFILYLKRLIISCRRSQWPSGLRRRSTATRLLRSRVQIPPGARMFVCCECCVLSGRGLCDELITRPEESYQL